MKLKFLSLLVALKTNLVSIRVLLIIETTLLEVIESLLLPKLSSFNLSLIHAEGISTSNEHGSGNLNLGLTGNELELLRLILSHVSPVINETTLIRLNVSKLLLPEEVGTLIRNHETKSRGSNWIILINNSGKRFVGEKMFVSMLLAAENLETIKLLKFVHSLGNHTSDSVHDDTLRETIAPAVSRNLLEVTSVTVERNWN